MNPQIKYIYSKKIISGILRFSERPVEQVHQTKAEMDWLYYLAKNNIGVGLPYGLIHNDMHQWNIYIDGDKINVFDFDDALYGWYALDIGVALYHGLWWGRKNDAANDFTNSLIKNFLKGYLSANHLSDFWLSKIPMFMKFRQICKFSWFFNPENIDDHQKERIRNIENNILFTDCTINPLLFSNENK